MDSFEKFWSSISENEMEKIADVANERVSSLDTDSLNPNTVLGTKIGIVSTMMTMQLLKKYHEWLIGQLGLNLED